jgi:hypothetical protein
MFTLNLYLTGPLSVPLELHPRKFIHLGTGTNLQDLVLWESSNPKK